MRIQSPGWTFSFSRRPILMALRTPLTFTFARSGRSRSSITSPGIPRHIHSPLVLPLTQYPPDGAMPSDSGTVRSSPAFQLVMCDLRCQQPTRHDLAGLVGDDADDALREAHAAGLLEALGEQCPAHREALAHEVLELVGLGDGVERGDCLGQALAPVTGADVVADCEADECFHPSAPPVRCAFVCWT